MSISEMKLIHDRLTALERTIAVQAAMIDELIGMSGGVAAARRVLGDQTVSVAGGAKPPSEADVLAARRPSLRSAG